LPHALDETVVTLNLSFLVFTFGSLLVAIQVAGGHYTHGIIEFVPQVGDFPAVDEPLVRLYGGAGAIDERLLREAVVLGTERTMLENLMRTLPPHRHVELRQQLGLLDRAVDGHYEFPEDRALAHIPDSQGLGGVVDMQPLSEAPSAEGGRRDNLL